VTCAKFFGYGRTHDHKTPTSSHYEFLNTAARAFYKNKMHAFGPRWNLIYSYTCSHGGK